jgi:hypothetical protein
MNIFHRIIKYRRLVKILRSKYQEIKDAELKFNTYWILGGNSLKHQRELLSILRDQLERLQNLLDELNF